MSDFGRDCYCLCLLGLLIFKVGKCKELGFGIICHGVKTKRNYNNITGIFDGSGILNTKDEATAQIAEYFSSMFVSYNVMFGNDILPHIHRKVTPAMNQLLIKEVSEGVIKQAMFMIGLERAPGPDGFTVSFYHHFLEVIAPDVCSMVNFFFFESRKPQINHTDIFFYSKILWCCRYV